MVRRGNRRGGVEDEIFVEGLCEEVNILPAYLIVPRHEIAVG